MARYTGPACRLCRREGKKLFLKGERCLSDKCAVGRRGTAPGQHGAANKKMQLREKQTAKRYYGIAEKQFLNYFLKADRKEGVTGDNLLSLIEKRFDNVIYRAGFANSRKEARQLVRHGHFRINGKKADIPSIILKVGDEITLKDKSRSSEKFKELIEGLEGHTAPKFLDLNKTNASIKVIANPTREDVDFDFEEHLIVELYSK